MFRSDLFKCFNATCESWPTATVPIPTDSPVKAEILEDEGDDDDQHSEDLFFLSVCLVL